MPGNNLPESFTPVLRLMIDSARSPITAAKPSSSPKMVAWVQFNAERCPGISLKSARLANNENPIAPKNPSHVFFGLMCGINVSPDDATGKVRAHVAELCDRDEIQAIKL